MERVRYKRVELNGDLLTPVSMFKRLSGEKKFLLESSFQHETKGKYSYVGANPYMEVIGSAGETRVVDLTTGEEKKYPLHALDYMKEHLPVVETDIPLSFTGGAVGYVAYDLVRELLDVGVELPDELGMPDLHFMVYDTIVAYEHRTEKVHVMALNVRDECEAVLDEKIARVRAELQEQLPIPEASAEALVFEPELDEAEFLEMVRAAKRLVEADEAEQIVLSQRMVAEMACDPFSFYRHLRSKNPSPYMFYIDFVDYLIVGSSPESLVQTNGREVITNPIAGTRPRGETVEADEALRADLLADEKEVAEHEMLVELSKDDLRGICEADSIVVPVYKDVVQYEHVMHMVSEVHGSLRDGLSSFDALLACLPAGTVSGAPKERAMQIINELEPSRRGVYAGGIGFISFNRDVNLAIAIRSLVVKDGKAYLQVGAGIVRDSVPESEFQETLQKARSLTDV